MSISVSQIHPVQQARETTRATRPGVRCRFKRVDAYTITLEDLAGLLRISRSQCYALAQRDALPVPVIKLGVRRMVVARVDVERLLGPIGSLTPPAAA